MSEPDDFATGDRVHHVTMGDGIVIEASHHAVRVRYEDATGIYDATWFARYPNDLVRRSNNDG
jgi:hypothetical protein